jgi:hypothetical protein
LPLEHSARRRLSAEFLPELERLSVRLKRDLTP